jgi:hypothetical protein
MMNSWSFTSLLYFYGAVKILILFSLSLASSGNSDQQMSEIRLQFPR